LHKQKKGGKAASKKELNLLTPACPPKLAQARQKKEEQKDDYSICEFNNHKIPGQACL
jgi:hypothetical protein